MYSTDKSYLYGYSMVVTLFGDINRIHSSYANSWAGIILVVMRWARRILYSHLTVIGQIYQRKISILSKKRHGLDDEWVMVVCRRYSLFRFEKEIGGLAVMS